MLILNITVGRYRQNHDIFVNNGTFRSGGLNIPIDLRYFFNKNTGAPERVYFQSNKAEGKIITSSKGYPSSVFMKYIFEGKENFISAKITSGGRLDKIERSSEETASFDTAMLNTHILAYMAASPRFVTGIIEKYKSKNN